MGGRGSQRSGGHRAPNGYSTVGMKKGIRIIQDKKQEKDYHFMGLKMAAFIEKAEAVRLNNIENMTVEDCPKKI